MTDLAALTRLIEPELESLGYDLVRSIERLPGAPEDTLGVPDAVVMIADSLVILDNVFGRAILVANVEVPAGATAAQRLRLYDTAQERLDTLLGRLGATHPLAPLALEGDTKALRPESRYSRADFERGVSKIREYIAAGDVFQAVLSRRQVVPGAVDPLRLYDCCLISDGGVAFIVTSLERARQLRPRPVRVLGVGQAHSPETISNPEWWYVPHQQSAAEQAYRMAGVGPADIDVAQLYDNFTISVIVWLEHAGFCKRGEGGAFVEGGRIRLGGDLPVNTAGGNLSESYMQGWLHIVEGVRQLRGDCATRQVGGAELCLVTGRGMTLNCAAAAVLARG